ncbi:MAG: WYL domain-containing protein [Clostridia bacterium]|nr:WYL domain-containing protein [Clostridia bacterium]
MNTTKAFAALNLKTFTQSHFGMFSGEKANVSLRCISPLLDTMIDRFGTKGVMYSRVDDRHFRVSVDVEISGQFFSWIAGFSTKVVIETPTIAKQYMDFLDKIKSKY